MKQSELTKLDRALGGYVDRIVSGFGPPARERSLGNYISGLLLDGERKSVEPIAERLVCKVEEREAMRQRLQQAVVVAAWSERELFSRLTMIADGELPGVEAFVVDDTGFPKKGKYSPAVQRQYSGTLGRTDNCQVAVSVHLASESQSACVGMELFLPESWSSDRERCRKAGIPEDVIHRTKWQMAIEIIDRCLSAGARRHVVLADAGYGDAGEFRKALTERGLRYLVAVSGVQLVWPPGSQPEIPKRKASGRPKSRAQDVDHPPVAITELAKTLPYRTVLWKEGSRGKQRGRFAAIRIRSAERRTKGQPPGEEQWLLCEWPEEEANPTKFYLSTIAVTASLKTLVRMAKMRWRVERDYQELKGEIGLDHFEGRTWRGFHHHVALAAAAHLFLSLQRALFPPEEQELDFA